MKLNKHHFSICVKFINCFTFFEFQHRDSNKALSKNRHYRLSNYWSKNELKNYDLDK